eukprot:9488784-Pyramimonas_sp.AAC.1
MIGPGAGREPSWRPCGAFLENPRRPQSKRAPRRSRTAPVGGALEGMHAPCASALQSAPEVQSLSAAGR